MEKKILFFSMLYNRSDILKYFLMCPKFWYENNFIYFISNSSVFFLNIVHKNKIRINFYLEEKVIELK